MIYLYHGTDDVSAKTICKAQKADIGIGSRSVDFGPGFYLTEDFEQAKRWASRKARVRSRKAAVVTTVFDVEGAENIIKRFDDDIIWGQFVINNRNGYDYINKVANKDNNLDARYPITFGRIADYDIKKIADELKNSGDMISQHQTEAIINVNYPTQYAFHTEKAISYLVKYSFQYV